MEAQHHRTAHLAWSSRTSGGSGPPVLLLHGFTDSAACMEPVARLLAAGGCTVVALDARGHGDSGLPDEPFTNEAHASDAAAVLRDAVDRPAVVIGHSMGALTAALLAAQHPELVAAVVLEDPPYAAEPPSDDEDQNPFEPWLRELQALDHPGRVARCREEYQLWPDDEVEPWATSKAQVNRGLFRLPQRWQARPLPETLARTSAPLLVLTGEPELGSIVSAADAGALAAAAPDARLLHVPGAGHSIRRDRRAAYLVAVRGLLAEVM